MTKRAAPIPAELQTYENALRKKALAYPQTREDHPWGECAFKVNGKVFLFMGVSASGIGMSFKLPHSKADALDLAFAQPTGYGLGKHGWVSARFEVGERPPLDLLFEWLDESFRAVAPKKAVAALDAGRKGK